MESARTPPLVLLLSFFLEFLGNALDIPGLEAQRLLELVHSEVPAPFHGRRILLRGRRSSSFELGSFAFDLFDECLCLSEHGSSGPILQHARENRTEHPVYRLIQLLDCLFLSPDTGVDFFESFFWFFRCIFYRGRWSFPKGPDGFSISFGRRCESLNSLRGVGFYQKPNTRQNTCSDLRIQWELFGFSHFAQGLLLVAFDSGPRGTFPFDRLLYPLPFGLLESQADAFLPQQTQQGSLLVGFRSFDQLLLRPGCNGFRLL